MEEAQPNLMKELLAQDHQALGTSKQRLAMAQKIINKVPEEPLVASFWMAFSKGNGGEWMNIRIENRGKCT